MAISDSDVQKQIRGFLNSAQGGQVEEKLHDAWATANGIRLEGNCDETLAVVEHYLYLRWIIAKWGPLVYLNPAIWAVRGVYDLMKLLRQAGLPNYEYREGKCPQSTLSAVDWAWTSRGREDGWADFLGASLVSSLAASVPDHPVLSDDQGDYRRH